MFIVDYVKLCVNYVNKLCMILATQTSITADF